MLVTHFEIHLDRSEQFVQFCTCAYFRACVNCYLNRSRTGVYVLMCILTFFSFKFVLLLIMVISVSPQGLRIGHLNICSLPNKIVDLKVFLNEHLPHILGISETKIKFEKTERENKITNDTLLIPGYHLLRRDCSAPLQTGIAIYVHNTIIKYVKRRNDLETGPVECVFF